MIQNKKTYIDWLSSASSTIAYKVFLVLVVCGFVSYCLYAMILIQKKLIFSCDYLLCTFRSLVVN